VLGMVDQCERVKASGERCRARPLPGSLPPLCRFHSPQTAAEQREARRKGGRKRSRKAATLPADEPDAPLATTADVVTLLGRTINQYGGPSPYERLEARVRRGHCPP
jgi:hypothetical protein